MMQAYGKNEHRPGRRRQFFDHVGDALAGDGAEIAVVKVVLFQNDHRKAIGRVHLRRCHRDAPHAVLRADVNLVALRHEHPRVNDVPVAVRRRIVFQAAGKGRGEIGLADGDRRPVRASVMGKLHQHRVSNPFSAQSAAASAR